MPLSKTTLPTASRALWEALLLKQAEEKAVAYPLSARPKMRELVRAANDRAEVANDLVEGHVASALALYREAALLYMAAFVVVCSDEALPDSLRLDGLLSRFRQLLQTRSVPIDEGKLERLVDRSGDDLLLFDHLDGKSATVAGQSAQEIVRKLGQLVEPRTVSEIRFDRGLRVAGLSLVVCALCVWSVVSFFGRTNIALHMPVTASGVHPAAKSPPGGLTDGVTTGTYGIHTSVSDDPWVQVDLQSVFLIDKVKVYNRGDGWFDDGLPMTLQFSEDGNKFVDVETRTTNFGQLIPWTAKGRGKKARYVRVRAGKGKYVTLNEVEVFGRKP